MLPTPPPARVPTEAEEYTERLKEVEGVCSPIIAQLYQRAGGAGGDGDDGEDLGDHDEL